MKNLREQNRGVKEGTSYVLKANSLPQSADKAMNLHRNP